MLKKQPPSKKGLHPRNRHRSRYDFPTLIKTSPALADFVFVNQYDSETIDFSDPEAVKMLNKALLNHYYGIQFWDLPLDYLCPPIPGRADYIHHIADLLAQSNDGTIPRGKHVKVLDVGVGANCIYPLIGHKEYGWRFVGSEVDQVAYRSARQIVKSNKIPESSIECRLQPKAADIFRGIVQPQEIFDLTISNPPFHASLEEAEAGTRRKLKNLSGDRRAPLIKNFGGKNKEIWCEGGEQAFIRRIIWQSTYMANNCLWFSSLVAKKTNLPGIYRTLKKAKVRHHLTIEMAQGQKISRIVAWTFKDKKQHRIWAQEYWQNKEA
ncbi:MAG: 23S rRNA (adenine(1618)-N(6))-methyltransferase RlmF [Bacteroidota bacterium]